MLIEHLAGKPPRDSTEDWLSKISKTVNLNPQVSNTCMLLDGLKTLEVITRNVDSSESENFYLVRGSDTFAISIDLHPSPVLKQVFSTLTFRKSK